ncbi:hypothetical protein ALQ26_00720 [Pseudomonas amygdali pv. lachrymans]|nr:hypothetical protein ALQ26_00720 [Pseudomonas amygdali pv. lachrymans]
MMSVAMPFPNTLDECMFVGALAQRRQLDVEPTDSIIKVLAKVPRLNLIAQAAIGG